MTDRIQRRVSELAQEADWLWLKLPGVLATLDKLQNHDLADNEPRLLRGLDPGASSTEASALRAIYAEKQHERLDALSAIAKGAVSELARAVLDVKDPDTDTARIAESQRCLEDALPDEWAKDRCTDNAVHLVDIGAGRQVPLCYPAFKRHQRWKRAQRGLAS